MLRGIDPLLYPDLLHALGAMGHGDVLAIVDRNFPAVATARGLAVNCALPCSVDAVTTLKAVLTVFPIDTYSPEIPAVMGMQVVDHPEDIPPVVDAAQTVFDAYDAKVTLIERFAFYDVAKTAFALIRTLEDRPYGNFLIRKGVV